MNLSTLLATSAALLVLSSCSNKPPGEEAGDAGAGNEAGAGSPGTAGEGGGVSAGDGGMGQGGSAGPAAGQGGNAGAGNGGTGQGGSAGPAAGQGGSAGAGNGGTGQGGSAGPAAGQGGNAAAGNGGMGQGGSAGPAAGQGGSAGAGNGGSGAGGGAAGSGGAGGCVSGQSTCAEDGYGFRVCGSDHAWGPRVPCAPNFQCDTTSGNCRRPTAPACLNTEVMLLVDRSSSIADVGASPWLREALSTVLPFVQHGNRIGLRQFPSGAGCAVGPASAMTTNNYSAIRATLSDAASDGSTPISGALSGLLPLFGDPNDAQAAILVTQGDENCDTQAGVIAASQALWQGGVRVYVVAVTTTADRTFLDRIAAAGGTGTSRLVTDLATFETALRAIFNDLSACQCDEVCQCGDGVFNPSIEQCDDSNLADSDGCTSTCTSRGKVVFRTSATFKGNFGGLASGDATCQRLADAVPLTGTFKAWLSDPAVATAAQRLSHSDEPYVMTGSDRPVLAGNWADLTDGTLASSINRDEHGVSSSGFAVWTGTWATGSSTCSDCVCDGWTSDTSTGAVGGDTAGTGWTFVYRNLPCSSAYGLYCFEQ